ncbi:MAG: 23S rRNA (uridine(2552)-2'-O)-methyltransferase, partial [candidate division Zixibacteria bacterium]|nr:23S rRNA (uridine(2552)-2'-O)-methyltransferase [candidate division Zixibacteria bacterium]
KEEQYRSRATYKLLQAVRKYGFIQSGDVVVDLGAAPGGWSQAAGKLVGQRGFVLGIDIEQIEPFNLHNVHAAKGNVSDPEITEQILEILPRSADAVISDVSPNISGIWELDHARQIDLARKSLQIATAVLRPRGNFFVKVFQGDMLKAFVEEVKQHFSSVKFVKPRASRKKSSEIYVLGMRLKGT